MTGQGVTPASYLSTAWMAWVLVVAPSVVVLARFVGAATVGARSQVLTPIFSLPALLRDLFVMFALASALRALVPAGLRLGSSFAPQAFAGALLAATPNNLVAAATLHPATTAGAWGAVLAMAIGPNLFVTGSVATIVCRRIARGSGSDLDPVLFTKLGLALVPIQLFVGWLGLVLVGAVPR